MYLQLSKLLLLPALITLIPPASSIPPNDLTRRVPAPVTFTGPKDSKGYPLIASIEEYIKSVVPEDKRNVVFFTNKEAQEIGTEFLNAKDPGLGGKGILYYDVFTDEVRAAAGIDKAKDPQGFWLWVYRGSTALGRIQAFKDVYIALDPGDCRTIFSPVQTYKSNGKVDQAGVGQVWKQAELPALVDNDNVERIFSVCKRNGKLETKLEYGGDEAQCPEGLDDESTDFDKADKVDPVPNSIRPSRDGSHE